MGDDAGSPAALLSARDVTAGYAGMPVCAPVTVQLVPGRALCLVGPNGAGKSTLLHTLVGLLPPLTGTVHFDGRAVDERDASFRRGVAEVLEDDAFFPSLTAREHLLLTARGHGVVFPDDVVGQELDAFGMTGRADALPSEMSSGQRRRMALAAAFVRPARLLVLDEPERRLDASMRHAVAARLARERDAGLALLFASHDPAFVDTVADDVLELGDDEGGRPDHATDAGTG